ncbi:mitochondrial carrier [Testicularia cyperi]|uniref:Mitochondrial glycine transporter n=1 Tax=Testicularia cyperi TaxID=1882483 RepID=A0A317XL82_9BASI|nr:mitochondrial carrier [Testicularia cyperi]
MSVLPISNTASTVPLVPVGASSSKKAVGKGGIPPYATLSFGALSGFASCVLLQPFDLLKTRLQQLDRLTISNADAAVTPSASSGVGRLTQQTRTQRLVGITKEIIHTHGYQGLWRGTTPTVIRNVPGVALYFYSVSHLRHVASQQQIPLISVATNAADSSAGSSTLAKLSTTGNLLTGAVARVSVGFILSPVTVVKARFESSNFSAATERTLVSSLREIHAQSGFRGFFQGFTATALRDAPYAGLYLALYEASKTHLAAVSKRMNGDMGTGNWMVVSGSGLIAGTLATLFTHPFDIIKTRMQTTPSEVLHQIAVSQLKSPNITAAPSTTTTAAAAAARSTSLESLPHESGSAARTTLLKPSLWTMSKHLWATSGPKALLDGLGLRCARKAASSAIGWSIFEGGRSWYSDREARRRLV